MSEPLCSCGCGMTTRAAAGVPKQQAAQRAAASDDWKTPRQPRLIGHLNDASGHNVAFLVDQDAVLIRRGGQYIRLGAAARYEFRHLYMKAEHQAEAWLDDAEVVDAEVWCELDGGCLQGPPGSHLFGPSCVTEAEAADAEARRGYPGDGTCGQCDHGLLDAPGCNCDPGPEGQHHPYCGGEPCPNGCWARLHPPSPAT